MWLALAELIIGFKHYYAEVWRKVLEFPPYILYTSNQSINFYGGIACQGRFFILD